MSRKDNKITLTFDSGDDFFSTLLLIYKTDCLIEIIVLTNILKQYYLCNVNE